MPLYLRETNYSGGTNLGTTLNYGQLDGNFIYLDEKFGIGPFTGSLSGSLQGTASYATTASSSLSSSYTVSSSYALTASSANNFLTRNDLTINGSIAINTTPDVNIPIKIVKNADSSTIIRFENTSTGSSAFSGFQMGSDISSGGTAFCNFVYASNGITENGVFKPNGTSLINTGNGGLNFLSVSQPIRFFTSTGFGTLRAILLNNGNFGLNNPNPSFLLDVSGSARITNGLQISGSTILTQVSMSLDFANDTAAAAGGVPLGGLYRNGNVIQIRLV
jgi:hypothetical protein